MRHFPGKTKQNKNPTQTKPTEKEKWEQRVEKELRLLGKWRQWLERQERERPLRPVVEENCSQVSLSEGEGLMTSPRLQPFDLGRAPQGWWVGNSQFSLSSWVWLGEELEEVKWPGSARQVPSCSLNWTESSKEEMHFWHRCHGLNDYNSTWCTESGFKSRLCHILLNEPRSFLCGSPMLSLPLPIG